MSITFDVMECLVHFLKDILFDPFFFLLEIGWVLVVSFCLTLLHVQGPIIFFLFLSSLLAPFIYFLCTGGPPHFFD